jgi:hypothetical protein
MDLLTEDGANVAAVGSASDALIAARSAELPAVVRSISDTVTEEEVAKFHVVYLNGHAQDAMYKGSPTDVLSLLGSACDAGLARDDITAPEELSDALRPCYDAVWWTMCFADPPEGRFGVCPEGQEDVWRGRFRAAADAWSGLYGDVWLDMVSYGPAWLATSSEEWIAAGQGALREALSKAGTPLDPGITAHLATFAIDEYEGKDVISYVKGYEDIAHYERSVKQLVRAARRLEEREALFEGDYATLLEDLADDDAVSLGDKLDIEAARYESSLLD